MRWIVIALAAMLAGLAIVGCGGSRETTFGEDDGSVEVEAGDRFRIELAANPGVGDDWSLAREPDPSVAVLVADGFRERRRRGRGRRVEEPSTSSSRRRRREPPRSGSSTAIAAAAAPRGSRPSAS